MVCMPVNPFLDLLTNTISRHETDFYRNRIDVSICIGDSGSAKSNVICSSVSKTRFFLVAVNTGSVIKISQKHRGLELGQIECDI